ncbi:Serine carboxypeptidases (lysosomal cathepsin A) [Handroanthus impetiginosus]|uniref:Carboxypeptidase n=1 Tax=Handroanthus impetiginosus TaxID=429701 RepID=A0A2G9I5I3_9LAMI|nr:Serine carboxypeptidases (lysosomal cathepsin A) [Handroanthus impetiginosus]
MVSPPWRILIIICAIQISVGASESHHEGDKIVSLPGQPKVDFQQYSGYITVDEKDRRSYFYYFVEAESDPASKPLVLWLNGGPGCSSIGAGAFSEHGPLQPNGNILVKNNYSWNKVANMLYLESPAGVGFSYSANKSFYESVDDEMTARDNLNFLEKWFEKFPEFKNREFYITGESYGGHYVPQLADLIIQSKAKINLKGIAIGNPLLEFKIDFNSRAEFFRSDGLISYSTYNEFTFVCNFSQIRRQAQTGTLTPICSRVIKLVSSEISRFIDTYDVTLDVCLSSVLLQSEVLNQLQDEPKINVCVEDETNTYLNRMDVQKALHARLVGVKSWSICSDILRYEMQNLEIPTIGILGSLVKSGIRVLVYSGDQDSVLPLTGTRKLVNGLAKDQGLNTTVPYSVWFAGRQVAGWTQVYGDFLSFATIRGASHEAPYSQPERSLVLFSSFVGGKPLPGFNGVTKERENALIRLI